MNGLRPVGSARIARTGLATKSYVYASAGVLLVLATLLLGSINLESSPPLWWDEGWTLCDARTWVELDHYGCLQAGEPAPSTLSAALPVVAPIVLSFRLFGVGIWQARVVLLLFTGGTLALLYYLTDKIYSRPVALGTLVILLLMPAAEVHPVFMGKQVLGEMPALFFLLAGYACFLLTGRNQLLFTPLAIGFWGIALLTKLQVRPFWALSLTVPLAVVLAKRHWRSASLLIVGLLGSYGAYRLLLLGRSLLPSAPGVPLRAPVSGMYEVSARVLVPSLRLAALVVALAYGLPILLGLTHATWKWIRNYQNSEPEKIKEVVRLMLLTLAGSWFAWYVALSAGWDRYLFPPMFLGSPFAAALLYDLTDRFNFPSTIKKAALALARGKSPHQALKLMGITFMLTLVCVTAVRALGFYRFYFSESDTSVVQVTRFFNTNTPADTLIETFDSELFVLLDRPYHYPPAQLSAELIRRTYLREEIAIEYDPLTADPDYLVVGRFSRLWDLYEPILATGVFRLHHTEGLYEIYERVR